ncbi:MAG: mannose-6-phosphate isomerase, class I [Treponema sp.]|nr:mannose-6-phosphate isomerase, class I [Treponema sp.]
MSNLHIDILGTDFSISTDQDAEYLAMLLEKYRGTIEKVQRLSGLKDPLKVAVLTGFLLCDDLEKAGSLPQSGNQNSEAERLTLGMISLLDSIVPGDIAVSDVVQASPEAPSGPEPKPPSLGQKVFKLHNSIKNYEWGSPEWIPSLMGEKNLSRIPWAEMWMGVNPAGPSRLSTTGAEEGPLLSDLIKENGETYLGRETSETYETLPFLFKVIAAAKPLSLQVHPNLEKARLGFDRENQEGIALDAPERSYKDPNHKPEIICALEPFAALCGFRDTDEIKVLLTKLIYKSDGPVKNSIVQILASLEGNDPHRALLEGLFAMDENAKRALAPFIKNQLPLLEREYPEHKNEWVLSSYFAGLHPGEAAVLAPLFLNIIELAPGEALFIAPGMLHAFIHGMGMELMADSDSVIRGGLSPKYINTGELLAILDFSADKPEVLKLPSPAPRCYSYPSPATEFKLSVIHNKGEELPYPEKGAAILFLSAGQAKLKNGEEELDLQTGESLFISAGLEGSLSLSGTFRAHLAACRSS